jgi:hypothetical protein
MRALAAEAEAGVLALLSRVEAVTFRAMSRWASFRRMRPVSITSCWISGSLAGFLSFLSGSPKVQLLSPLALRIRFRSGSIRARRGRITLPRNSGMRRPKPRSA